MLSKVYGHIKAEVLNEGPEGLISSVIELSYKNPN